MDASLPVMLDIGADVLDVAGGAVPIGDGLKMDPVRSIIMCWRCTLVSDLAIPSGCSVSDLSVYAFHLLLLRNNNSQHLVLVQTSSMSLDMQLVPA